MSQATINVRTVNVGQLELPGLDKRAEHDTRVSKTASLPYITIQQTWPYPLRCVVQGWVDELTQELTTSWFAPKD